MNKVTKFSAVPVGEIIRYKNLFYTKSSYGRAKSYQNGTVAIRDISVVKIKKHEIVEWVNPWPTNIEK